MISSASVFVALTVALSFTAKAQTVSIPDNATIPDACVANCTQTLTVYETCEVQYAATNQTAACFCNGLPSDLDTCATCLSSNGQTELGASLTELETTCSTELADCYFECDFTTCDTSDQTCMCTTSYLQDVLNCAGCNSAKGLNGTFSLDQYETLAQSCLSAGLTAVPTTTENLPSPSGTTTQEASSAATTTTTSDGVSSAVAAATSAAAASSTAAATASSSSASAATSSSSSTSSAVSSSTATSGASRLTTGAAAIPALFLLGIVL